MVGHSKLQLIRTASSVLSTMIAATPAQATAAPSPAVSRAKTGLRVAGIGLILSSILYIIGPTNVVIVWTIFVVGSALVFSGRSAWPAHKGSVAAGFGIIIVGYIIGIVAAILNIRVGNVPITELTAVDVAAFRNVFIVTFVAGAVTEIGVLVLPWRLASGGSKGLIVAGAGLSIVGLLTEMVLALGVLAGVTGGSLTTNQRNALVTSLIIGISIIIVGGIIGGVGYFLARRRLPAAEPAKAAT